MATAQRGILPGFGLSTGITTAWLGLIVVLPLSTIVLKTSTLTWPAFVRVVTSARAVASYQLSFGAAFVAAAVNVVCGLLVAWVLVRYPFPGRRIVDAMVDLPFALPTAVSGIALTAVYSDNGWVGRMLMSVG